MGLVSTGFTSPIHKFPLASVVAPKGFSGHSQTDLSPCCRKLDSWVHEAPSPRPARTHAEAPTLSACIPLHLTSSGVTVRELVKKSHFLLMVPGVGHPLSRCWHLGVGGFCAVPPEGIMLRELNEAGKENTSSPGDSLGNG